MIQIRSPQELGPSLEAYLLGRVDYLRCQALQERLVAELSRRNDGQIQLLLCEHPDIITVGRSGDPAEVQFESGLIRSGQVPVRWVKRGGACLLHTLGQLAVYALVPLDWHRWSVGQFMDRFRGGVGAALGALGVSAATVPGREGLWGRTGQLVSFGVAVRSWVTYQGAFVNVCPRMGLFRLLQSGDAEGARKSCLVAERTGPVRMTSVRAELVRHLAAALGCDRYHLYTGHPLLRGERIGSCPDS